MHYCVGTGVQINTDICAYDIYICDNVYTRKCIYMSSWCSNIYIYIYYRRLPEIYLDDQVVIPKMSRVVRNSRLCREFILSSVKAVVDRVTEIRNDSSGFILPTTRRDVMRE